MKMLNLGCGNRFTPDWVNIDFVKTGEIVQSHNLLEGIPYMDNNFDVVYHSHLLEHFSKTEGIKFIAECYRVLKPEGIIRIAVPDLEEIAKNYLKKLEGALDGDPVSTNDYEWIMLELYDQTVRNMSGGEMAKYLSKTEIPNSEYVFTRIGMEGKALHDSYLNSANKNIAEQIKSDQNSTKHMIKKMVNLPKTLLTRFLFRKEYEKLKYEIKALELGRFRLSGEVHQWMYDRYSLSLLLRESGFVNIKVVNAFESTISEWRKYELDVKNGVVLKPDSLIIEALKPA